jgi:Peptidase A4 family
MAYWIWNNKAALRICRNETALSAALSLCLIVSARTEVFPMLTPPTPIATKKAFAPASVFAAPGLQCNLYPFGGDPSKGINVFTDDDGYARFHAVKATAADTVRLLTLACGDPAGKLSTYSVDLTSDETFAARPIDLAKQRGIDRPALTGNPLEYSQAELIRLGFGLRPDPTDTAAYARWHAAASLPGRILQGHRPIKFSNTVFTMENVTWVGSVLNGLSWHSLSSSSTSETGTAAYVSSEATFIVPQAIPGGDGTTTTHVSIWNGLGGYSLLPDQGGLIQGGIQIGTTPYTASYVSFREYCCGNPKSNGYGGYFTPNPGDKIWSISWYCDASGKVDINGNYGCTFIQNMTKGDILNCTLPAGSPCWSVPAQPLCSVNPSAGCEIRGDTAECIMELQLEGGPTWTVFTSQLEMDCNAYSSATKQYSQTVSTDSLVYLLESATNTLTQVKVTLGNLDQTYFNVFETPPPPVDCVVLITSIHNMTTLGMAGPTFRAARWAQIETILQQCVLSHKISQHQKDVVINEYNDYLAIHSGPSPRPPGRPPG